MGPFSMGLIHSLYYQSGITVLVWAESDFDVNEQNYHQLKLYHHVQNHNNNLQHKQQAAAPSTWTINSQRAIRKFSMSLPI